MKIYMRAVGILTVILSAGVLLLNGLQIYLGVYDGGPLVSGYDPTSSGQVIVPVFTLIGLALILDFGIDAIRFGWKKRRGGRLIVNAITMFFLIAMFQVLAYIYQGDYLITGYVAIRYLVPSLYLAGAIKCAAQKERLIINPTASGKRNTTHSLGATTTGSMQPKPVPKKDPLIIKEPDNEPDGYETALMEETGVLGKESNTAVDEDMTEILSEETGGFYQNGTENLDDDSLETPDEDGHTTELLSGDTDYIAG